MSKYPNKVDFWRQKGFDVVEQRGWVRKVRSLAKERLSQQEYVDCMKQVGWESII
ncbi:hypothetical protein ABS315_11285 [Peribacillus frigoritolerans]|uniref:hypothetical protein n=1 Tax=Peribacillus frigoritolerans TaxID=450367 RepID=UPI0034E06EF1